MKQTHAFVIAGLALVVSLGSFGTAQAATHTFVATNQELATLEMQLKVLQAQLNKLSGIEVESDERQNLSISSTRLKKTVIDGSAEEVENQRITILAKNNRYGGTGISEDRFGYSVELYEVDGRKRTKLNHWWSGIAVMPSADLKSEFRIEVDSARYVGEDDRTFVAKVTFDPARVIQESNEKDNVKWTEEWTIAGE